jgi:chromosome segregation ATPase
MSEVRRWKLDTLVYCFTSSSINPHLEYIDASDHDRIVAEQRQAYEAALENHVSLQMLVASRAQEIAELKADLQLAEENYADQSKELADVRTAARAQIAKLREQRNDFVSDALKLGALVRCDLETYIKRLDAEVAAIK